MRESVRSSRTTLWEKATGTRPASRDSYAMTDTTAIASPVDGGSSGGRGGPPSYRTHKDSVSSCEPLQLPEIAEITTHHHSRDFRRSMRHSMSKVGYPLFEGQLKEDQYGIDIGRKPSLLHHDIPDTVMPLTNLEGAHGGGHGEMLANTTSTFETDDTPDEPPPAYPSAAKTALIMVSLYISIFLVALDRTIIGPAIPTITDLFHSTDDIGWYGASYMLTSSGFILLYGRIYTFFNIKWVFLCGILLFEVGSAVCGAANSSLVLIIGRAVAGVGSSGIFTGAILIMLNTVPLHRRPMLQGLFGACFGVASVAGPLLGGAFTGSPNLTWRWCFYINLPLGGFTIIVVALFLHLGHNPHIRPKNWADTVKKLDPVGTLLFLPAITCLLLALEWGAEGDWNQPQIIALLAIFAVLAVVFVWWQYWTRHTNATVPARILFQRSVAFGGLSQFCVGATMLTVSIYIPIWFQAIQDVSPMDSGIRTIPLVLSVVVGSISSGGMIQTIARGYYTPFMIIGSSLMAAGTGILTTWDAAISMSMWIAAQVMLGLGVGWTMQQPNLAVQVVLQGPDIPTGTALLSLFQTLGGAVFVAVGQNVFINKFTTALRGIPGIEAAHLAQAGVTEVKNRVPEAIWPVVLRAYNASLTQGPFFAALIVACLAVPFAFGMEWRSVKEQQNGRQKSPGGGAASAASNRERSPADRGGRTGSVRSVWARGR